MTFYLAKQPAEETTFGIDMSGFREIQEGEKITSHTVTCPTAGIIVSSLHTDSTVSVRVKGGTDGLKYTITIRASTDAGHVREVDVVLEVRERP
jgi:hypothetical protein